MVKMKLNLPTKLAYKDRLHDCILTKIQDWLDLSNIRMAVQRRRSKSFFKQNFFSKTTGQGKNTSINIRVMDKELLYGITKVNNKKMKIQTYNIVQTRYLGRICRKMCT